MILIAPAYVLGSLSFYGVIHLTGVCTKGWHRSYAAAAGNYWRFCQPDLSQHVGMPAGLVTAARLRGLGVTT